MSNSWIDSGDGTGIFCDADADNNLLQLKLKKPKSWKWELTTSRSSPNIAMPRIMLFDHKGTLLVDANQQVDDAVYRPPSVKKSALSKSSSPKRKTKKFDRAATTNLDKILLQDDEDTGLGSLDSAERQWFRPLLSNDSLKTKRKPSNFRNANRKGEDTSAPYEIDIDSLQICEATDSNSQSPLPICEIVDSSTQSSPPPPLPSEDNKDLEEELNIDAPWRRKLSLKTKYIESSDLANHHPVNLNIPVIFSENEGTPERQYISKASWKPFYSNGCLNVIPSSTKPFERRATSFKEVRFKVDPETETSKGEEQKLKRRCRRSNTNNLPNLTHSRSILERQSARKGRLSSPEFETFESHEVRMAPRYFLRTCRAGTLVVAEESGRYKRTRRRIRKTSSTENVLSHSSSSLLRQKGILNMNSSLGDPCSQSQSVKNFGEYNGSRSRRKAVPIRRHRSDGNILLVTSSEEDNCDKRKLKHQTKNTVWRHKNGDVKTYEDSNE